MTGSDQVTGVLVATPSLPQISLARPTSVNTLRGKKNRLSDARAAAALLVSSFAHSVMRVDYVGDTPPVPMHKRNLLQKLFWRLSIQPSTQHLHRVFTCGAIVWPAHIA